MLLCVSRKGGHVWKELGCESEGRSHGAHIQRRQKCTYEVLIYHTLSYPASYSLSIYADIFEHDSSSHHMLTHVHTPSMPTAAVSVQQYV